MNIYKVDMFCKHFKGDNLLTKNIYCIVGLNLDGKDLDPNIVTYTGDNTLATATNLVAYKNIFQQDKKIFVREYDDISSTLSEIKQKEYGQTIKVQPLTNDEIAQIMEPEFIALKKEFTENKFKTR